jgi:photosystem II stability/assembly factor-like uncharacterized protein
MQGFYKTTDGGENWVEVITAPDNTIVYTLTPDPNSPSTFFAGTWPDGVYKSTDGGENWHALDTGLGVGTFVSLVSSPQDPRTLYGVGLNSGMGTKQVEGNLSFYVSQDGGEHWSRVETGLTDILAFSLLADPENQGSVYLGSLFGVFKGTFHPGK